MVLEVRPPVALDKGLGVSALLQSAVEREGTSRSSGPCTWATTAPISTPSGRCGRSCDAGTLELAVRVAVGSEETPPELAAQADLIIDGQSGVRGLLQALL